MSSNLSRSRNRAFVITGLGVALLIAILLSTQILHLDI